jgi:hypothetical protein
MTPETQDGQMWRKRSWVHRSDQYGGPLTTFNARDVFNTIKADMADRPDVYKGYRYELALSDLELLTRSPPSVEVIFDRYTFARVGR